MKKKIVTLFLATALSLGLAVPAMAVSTETVSGAKVSIILEGVVEKTTISFPEGAPETAYWLNPSSHRIVFSVNASIPTKSFDLDEDGTIDIFYDFGWYYLTSMEETNESGNVLFMASHGTEDEGALVIRTDGAYITLSAEKDDYWNLGNGGWLYRYCLPQEPETYVYVGLYGGKIETDPADEPLYKDVKENDWYFYPVNYISEKSIMTGTSADTFSPNETLSRATLATVLYRLDGEPFVDLRSGFSDVPDGQWYSDAISWATITGVVGGYDDGLFGTNDSITREQFVTMMYRYAAYKGYSTSEQNDLSGFVDSGNIDSWALEPMQWVVAEGIISGTSATTLSPKGTATRAECAAILMRFIENV